MKVNAITLGIVVLVWVLAFAGGLGGAYVYISKNIPPPPPVEETVVAAPEPPKPEDVLLHNTPETKEDVKAVVGELKIWRGDLEKQRDKLLALDTEIQRRDAVMKAEREALERERQKIVEMQKELEGKIQGFEGRILSVNKDQEQNLKDLASLLGKMKIDQQVNLVKQLPDDQVTKLFTFLPQKQLAKLLETWSKTYPKDRERLVQVTEELRRVVKQDAVKTSTNANP